MLLTLPCLVFLLLLLILMGLKSQGQSSKPDWRGAFIRAAVLWGGLIVLVSEGLSLFNAINQLWVSICWSLFIIVLMGFGLRKGLLRSGWQALRSSPQPFGVMDSLLLMGIVVILLVLLVVAWISPPNNVDSYLYHMSRVVHWAQNQNLNHYATQYDHQLLKPIWAESAILNLRVLWGSDKPANLVQWFSMLGAVVGVSSLAALMGVKRRGQLLASVFALSAPIGLLQATTAYNDLVAAFWVICMTYFIVFGKKHTFTKFDNLGMAISFGVGILTKGHFFVYALPLLLWHFVPRLFRARFSRTVLEGVFVLIVALSLNAGFWTRNIQTYGGPYGTSDWLRRNLWFAQKSLSTTATEGGVASITLSSPNTGTGYLLSGRAYVAGDKTDQSNDGQDTLVSAGRNLLAVPNNLRFSLDNEEDTFVFLEGIQNWLVRLAQTVGRNFVAPTSQLHAPLIRFLELFPSIFSDDYVNEQRYAAWNQEDTSGNPFHLLMVPISFIALLLLSGKKEKPFILIFACVMLTAYAIGPIIIGHAPSRWGVRYQLPFFMLWGPVVGAAFQIPRREWVLSFISVSFLLSAIPYLLLNNHRPIIGMPPWPTRTRSIFQEEQENLLFAMNLGLKDDYMSATDLIKQVGCDQVALASHSFFLEYPFWWLLDAPQSGVRIESLYSTPHSRVYADHQFKPCAVICTVCEEQQIFDGLERWGQVDSVVLFYNVK